MFIEKRVFEFQREMATEALILKESALLTLRSLKSLFMLIYAVVMVLVLPFRGRRKVSPVEKDEKHHDCHRKGAVVRVPAKMVPWKSSISISSNGGCGGGAAVKAVDQVAAAVARRRELAIRRVVDDDDQRCVREYWLLGTRRGDTIFTQSWTPVSVKIR